MPDKYIDLLQYISTAALTTYNQFQRFLLNLKNFQQEIDETNETPSPEELEKQIK